MELSAYLPQLLSIATLATIMAISPGADFVMITRNSLVYGRRAGFYSALGAGVSDLDSRCLFHSRRGAAHCPIGGAIHGDKIHRRSVLNLPWLSKPASKAPYRLGASARGSAQQSVIRLLGLRQGFITNALNPKTTLFFLSIFTQLVSADTPVAIQLVYGLIISLAHLLWFVLVAMFFSHFAFVHALQCYQRLIEKTLGVILMGLGVRVATLSQ